MCPKNINCVALFILPEWIIFEITHFSKMTKILPFSVKKWENCQWNESFGCTYDFLRIRCWMTSLFNHKHWVSFRQQLGNICWLVKNSQIFRNCLYKTSNIIFSVGTKTLTGSNWEIHISFRISCIFWKQSLTDVGQTGKTSFNSRQHPQHWYLVFVPQTTQ